MVKPDLHFSSLSPTHSFHHSPYKDWTELASTEQEWDRLIVLFRGMPRGWLEWADDQTEKAAARGVTIRKPLNYRLAVLWNGMILLQEAKFICDWMEHALRQGFISHLRQSRMNVLELRSTMPRDTTLDAIWKELFDLSASSINVTTDDNITRTTERLVNSFTFYVLTETIRRNWVWLGKTSHSTKGFQQIFWSAKNCRSSDSFVSDMKRVRTMRNVIAHSKRLLAKHEVSEIYLLVCHWLTPLNVDLNARILDYRNHRPRFLGELKF